MKTSKTSITDRQKELLTVIYRSIKSSGYPPTYEEMRNKLEVSSNQAILDVLQALENKRLIKREEGAARGIKILTKGFNALAVKPMVPSLGITSAGLYKDAFENLEWKEVEDLKTAQGVFIVDVSGDSMIGAGIEDGDKVLIQEAREFKNGDVVLARDNDGTTVKTLVNQNGRIYLKPENPKYPNIPIYPETRLLGKVIGKLGKKFDISNTSLLKSKINFAKNTIYHGDCEAILRDFPSDSIDLIVTSPPYADSRKSTYGGIAPDKYVEWFLPKTEQFLRVLKPSGTFILNIKEKVVSGERHTYVLNLILEMRKQGWLWTEEYIWHKKNCYPGKWPNRFRDAWERCLQFNKSKNFKMFQDKVMVPMGNWAESRLKNLSEVDKRRDDSKVNSGFGKNVSNWLGRDKVYPTNVLYMASECSNKSHSAVFPEDLPSWFIKLFSEQGDIVLDPFLGSGTTALAAKKIGRDYIGIDILPEYCKMAEDRLSQILL